MENTALDAAPPRPRGNPLRYSLKSLLLLVLLASAYYAGRAPMVHRVERAERERNEAKDEAKRWQDEAMTSAQRLQVAEWQRTLAREIRSINEGMMIDSLEHQQRYMPLPPLTPLTR